MPFVYTKGMPTYFGSLTGALAFNITKPMPSSNEILRQATKIVAQYEQRIEYYSGECSKHIDPKDVSFSPDFIIELNKSHIEKLLETVDRASQDAQWLIEYIEHKQLSFFVKNIYRSPNWSIAYQLMRNFVTQKLDKARYIAEQHAGRIEEYASLPKPVYYEALDEISGDYHDDIQATIEKLHLILNIDKSTDNIGPINYNLLILLHASCYIIKLRHRVNLYAMEWNTFKSSLESWFYELANAKPTSSTMTKLDDGSTVITDYVSRCRLDMDKIEDIICSHIDAPNLLPIIVGELPASSYICTKDDLVECLDQLCNIARDRIMPKVIYVYRNEF